MRTTVITIDVAGPELAALRAAEVGAELALVALGEAESQTRLAELAPGADAVIVGDHTREPLALVQRSCVSAPNVPVLVLASAERCAAITESLRFAPYVGDAQCVANGDLELFRGVFLRVLARARQRRAFDRTIAAVNSRLAVEPRPSPRAADVLARLVESAPVGVVLLDGDGRVLGWNPTAQQLFATSEREALGEPMERFLSTEDAQVILSLRERLASGEKSSRALFRRSDLPGADYVELTIARVSPHEPERGFIVVVQDATERVNALEELQRAVRTRDEFLSIASHELNTPLTPLKLQLGLVRKALQTVPDPARREELLARIARMDRQVHRLEVLVRDMLDVSRITARGVELQPAPADLVQLVRSVVSHFEEETRSAEVSIGLTAPDRVDGVWDRGRLEMVISNLVSNALKYGLGKPVKVWVEERVDAALIRVADEGIGIAAEHLDRIFVLYERAVSSGNFGGFGIGLYLAQSLVTAMGGTIRVESELGKGSMFEVTIPKLPPQSISDLPGHLERSGGPAGTKGPVLST